MTDIWNFGLCCADSATGKVVALDEDALADRQLGLVLPAWVRVAYEPTPPHQHRYPSQPGELGGLTAGKHTTYSVTETLQKQTP